MKHFTLFGLLLCLAVSSGSSYSASNDEAPALPVAEPLRVALSGRHQRSFLRQLEDQALPAAQMAMNDKLCLPLVHNAGVASGCTPVPRQPSTAAVQLYAAQSGFITKFFATDATAFDRAAPVGSVGKVLAAALIASSSAPEATWCPKAVRLGGRNIGNADRSTGRVNCDSGGAIRPEEAVAKSNNLACIDRLSQVPVQVVMRELDGLEVGYSANAHPLLAHEVCLGIVQWSPRRWITFFGSVLDVRWGNTTRLLAASSNEVSTKSAMHTLLDRPGVRFLMQRWLAAVTQRGGTAAHLVALHNSDKDLWAKTGTSTGIDGQTNGKFLIWGRRDVNGQVHVYWASVTSPYPSQTLGLGLVTSDFASLHAALMDTSMTQATSEVNPTSKAVAASD